MTGALVKMLVDPVMVMTVEVLPVQALTSAAPTARAEVQGDGNATSPLARHGRHALLDSMRALFLESEALWTGLQTAIALRLLPKCRSC